MLRDLLHDLRYGLRGLRRSPGFTTLVVLSLAVGIGANAAIFSLVNFVFLRSLPVRDPGGLVLFSGGFGAGSNGGALGPGPIALYPYRMYQRLRDQNHGFESLAAQMSGQATVVVRSGRRSTEQASSELADGRLVSANYFGVLGVPAHRGRTFLPEDETAPGANPVMVLSHRYWLRRFGGDPLVLGSSLEVRGTSYTVVGITPPGFTGTRVGVEVTDFWVPMTMQAALNGGESILDRLDHGWLVIVARLRPGVSMAAAEASVNATLQQYLAEQPALVRAGAKPQQVRITLAPGGKGVSPLRRPETRAPLLVMGAGVGLLLLIVCLNVSHLLLARAIGRQREMSIRTALGATRTRLVRQLLAEGLLLSTLGGAAAVLATAWFIDGLVAFVPADVPLAIDVKVDGHVLWFTTGLALATAVLLGAVPAFAASRADLQQAMQGTSQAIAGGGSRRLVSRLLLTSQVALSLVLLVGAGLLTASLGNLREMNKGFDEEHLLLVGMKPSLAGVPKDQALGLNDDILRKVTALPGVRGASLSVFEVLSGGHTREQLALVGASRSRSVEKAVVTPGYFETMGMALARGRGFSGGDVQGAPLVAVVNEALARWAFGAKDALGQRFHFPGPGDAGPAIEVVGIVRDAKNNGLREQTEPMVYQPVAQVPKFLGSLQVRAVADPALLTDQVRRALREVHAGLPVVSVRTMRSQVDRALTGDRVLATLASAFGLGALFLVCIGLYGVIAAWAAQRTREIGVRMALGATIAGVRWMVMRQAFALVLAGLAVGLPAAIAVARLLRAFLFGVSPMDPATLTGAALVMLAVAALAAYLPARRASSVDPMMALRCE